MVRRHRATHSWSRLTRSMTHRQSVISSTKQPIATQARHYSILRSVIWNRLQAISSSRLHHRTGRSFPLAVFRSGGSSTNRTLQITPTTNLFRTATITVTVSDGSATKTDTFVLTVSAVNDPPTISNILNQSTSKNTPTGDIPFTVGDIDTPVASLRMSATSSNTTLVPNANIVFVGTEANRTLRISPALNQTGTATITVRVSDGSATAADTFVLSVKNISTPRSANLKVSPAAAAPYPSVAFNGSIFEQAPPALLSTSTIQQSDRLESNEATTTPSTSMTLLKSASGSERLGKTASTRLWQAIALAFTRTSDWFDEV